MQITSPLLTLCLRGPTLYPNKPKLRPSYLFNSDYLVNCLEQKALTVVQDLSSYPIIDQLLFSSLALRDITKLPEAINF